MSTKDSKIVEPVLDEKEDPKIAKLEAEVNTLLKRLKEGQDVVKAVEKKLSDALAENQTLKQSLAAKKEVVVTPSAPVINAQDIVVSEVAVMNNARRIDGIAFEEKELSVQKLSHKQALYALLLVLRGNSFPSALAHAEMVS